MVAFGGLADELQRLGGKGLHLRLLKDGGFCIPPSFAPQDAKELSDGMRYIARSSAAGEDSHAKTSAGIYITIKGVRKEDLESACQEVQSYYPDGSVIIQPDLSSVMQFSGVVYSNLDGSCVISGGRGSFVQEIVEGRPPETEIRFHNKTASLRGIPTDPRIIELVRHTAKDVEDYFGIPMDIEFAVINDQVTLLQARPLPNPTESALREHEARRLQKATEGIRGIGLEELVFGVGNYREILANAQSTHLSTSTFNYIFSGDGKEVLGAVQLGRNELGYDTGTEIFPWVIMANGKVYYNFAGDALQFRPRGIKRDDLLAIINQVYLPMVRGDPDLLNYPELRLYVQFPEQAERVGLDPQPFRKLAESNRKAIGNLKIPANPPLKRRARAYESLEDCLSEINAAVGDIRTDSAKEYVQAARLAFFALEDVRQYLERLQECQPTAFRRVAELFGKPSPGQLRDEIVYDESICSFEVEENEEFRYLGSFELSQPRGFPPCRHFKQGRDIPDAGLADLVKKARGVLGYREKVKFALFRDYDYLKQLYEQAGRLSGFEKDMYYLEFDEFRLLAERPRLAFYRIEIRKKLKEKSLLPDPIFEPDLSTAAHKAYGRRPQLIFGSLPAGEMYATIGKDGYVVDSVDQTIEIPESASIIFVPDNIRPGSHLFTILSDYGLPVIGVPQEDLDTLKNHKARISSENGQVSIRREE
ncbi:MAG TPA: hypothetical protein VJC16_03765 [Candidatus Nanoarchaeia archaeon]|nr:hypothetical protein [Candidatus Nanoarchaeia archaeon]